MGSSKELLRNAKCYEALKPKQKATEQKTSLKERYLHIEKKKKGIVNLTLFYYSYLTQSLKWKARKMHEKIIWFFFCLVIYCHLLCSKCNKTCCLRVLEFLKALMNKKYICQLQITRELELKPLISIKQENYRKTSVKDIEQLQGGT